jgi:hypothetical protein
LRTEERCHCPPVAERTPRSFNAVATLALARRFSRLDGIRIGLLLDDEDKGGPAQVSDLEGLTNAPPAALTRRNGKYVWRSGVDARTNFCAVDGIQMDAIAISPNDILALAAATDAPMWKSIWRRV